MSSPKTSQLIVETGLPRSSSLAEALRWLWRTAWTDVLMRSSSLMEFLYVPLAMRARTVSESTRFCSWASSSWQSFNFLIVALRMAPRPPRPPSQSLAGSASASCAMDSLACSKSLMARACSASLRSRSCSARITCSVASARRSSTPGSEKPPLENWASAAARCAFAKSCLMFAAVYEHVAARTHSSVLLTLSAACRKGLALPLYPFRPPDISSRS
mmetsp:Transcript_84585/g.217950  ORF Transcript_84585/g.217950 Transcript_84585/m.217950 type:complete len:216 (+) Transcript_84585:462-1109(+)